MKPTHYTTHPPRFTWSESPVYVFHYKFSDLRAFITECRESGRYGHILMQFDSKAFKYKGYSTSTNHNPKQQTFNVQYVPEFYGEFNPEKYINPEPEKPMEWSFLIPKGILSDSDKIPTFIGFSL